MSRGLGRVASPLPRTPQCQLAPGACDGGPGPAEGQQQSSLGGLRKDGVKVAGGQGAVSTDGCVPEDDRGPHAAPGLHMATHVRVCLHGSVCPAPAWALAAGLLGSQAGICAVRGQGARAVGGAGGIGGDAGAALRGGGGGWVLRHPAAGCRESGGSATSGPGWFAPGPETSRPMGLGLGKDHQIAVQSQLLQACPESHFLVHRGSRHRAGIEFTRPQRGSQVVLETLGYAFSFARDLTTPLPPPSGT